MPSIARNRSRKLKGTVGGTRQTQINSYVGGTFTGFTTTTSTSGPYPAGSESMADSLSLAFPFDDHPLDHSYRKILKQGMCSGIDIWPDKVPTTGTQTVIRCTNWSSSIVGSIWNSGIPTIPSVNYPYMVNKVLAGVNPNKPIVDVPLFFFELREFPRMLKEMGDMLWKYRNLAEVKANAGISPSDLGKASLAFSFGWAPFFQDLKTLDGFARAYRQRLATLLKAKQGKRHRMTLQRSDEPEFKRRTSTLLTVGTRNLNIEVKDRLITHVWATMRFEPKNPNDRTMFDRLLNKADPLSSDWILDPNNLLGMRKGISAATLWNSYPWTWLIDYLSDISTFLETGRGYVPFHVRDLNIMASQEIVETSTVLSNQTRMTYRPHEFRIGSKQRRVYPYPYPSLTLNFQLSGRRAWNLGSLVTAKSARSLNG